MQFPLIPVRLWFLFSIAGYTKAEIHGLTLWSPDEIERMIARLSMPWWNPIAGRGEIRDRIEAIRTERNREAALEAVEQLLEAIAGPPLTEMA